MGVPRRRCRPHPHGSAIRHHWLLWRLVRLRLCRVYGRQPAARVIAAHRADPSWTRRQHPGVQSICLVLNDVRRGYWRRHADLFHRRAPCAFHQQSRRHYGCNVRSGTRQSGLGLQVDITALRPHTLGLLCHRGYVSGLLRVSPQHALNHSLALFCGPQTRARETCGRGGRCGRYFGNDHRYRRDHRLRG